MTAAPFARPVASVSIMSSRAKTVSLALTLLVIRFWTSTGRWNHVWSQLPRPLQVHLQRVTRYLGQHASSMQQSILDVVRPILLPLLLPMPSPTVDLIHNGLADCCFQFTNLSEDTNCQEEDLLTPTTCCDTKNLLQIQHHPPNMEQHDAPTSILLEKDECCSTTHVTHFWSSTGSCHPDNNNHNNLHRSRQSPSPSSGDSCNNHPTSHANASIDRIRQNQVLIHSILHYWFGQYPPELAQKKLWMIASSSTEWRHHVDEDIAQRFSGLLTELAAAATPGDSNQQQDHTTTTTTACCRWTEWCHDQELYGYQGKLAAILVLDQFSRHIIRHNTEKNNVDDPPPPQTHLDQLALRTAQLLTQHHDTEIVSGMIPVPQYIFALMPFRHANTIASVTYVQTCVEQAAGRQEQCDAMTSRFRKATNRRLAGLQDEARRQGKCTTAQPTVPENGIMGAHKDNRDSTEAPANDSASAVIQTAFTEEDILETFPFEADNFLSEAPHHLAVQIIQQFLQDRGIYATTSGNDVKPNKGGKKNKNGKKQPKNKNNKSSSSSNKDAFSSTSSVIVSLSGGVDSMVIASVLAYLRDHGGYDHLNIAAIHIDYANRPESQAEAEYVRRYCERLKIEFHLRTINEVTRGITARDEYEQRARQARYDMYRSVAAELRQRHHHEHNNKSNNKSSRVVGVMLGHHRGDLRENVLSNAHKGCGPLDLSGMTAVSENDGVTIYRPLLPLEKTIILDYAHKFCVPYFKDTTPHWSTRGKLRNKLLPLLEEIYGEGSMNNLSTLATESDDCRGLLYKLLLQPFLDQVERKPMGITFDTATFVARSPGLFFWKFVLREVLHSAGLGMFSDKSVESFLERIHPTHTYKKTIREGWLQCRRDYAVYLRGDGKVFVFFPDSFPFRNVDAYPCAGQIMQVAESNTVKVGPWSVQAEVVEAADDVSKYSLLSKKAVLSMDEFMEGHVEYYLEVPTNAIAKASAAGEEANHDNPQFVPNPLVFVSSFTKATRPPAWKNVDDKIQTVLPLLGNTEDSLLGLKDPVGNGFGHTIAAEDGSTQVVENPSVLVKITLGRDNGN